MKTAILAKWLEQLSTSQQSSCKRANEKTGDRLFLWSQGGVDWDRFTSISR